MHPLGTASEASYDALFGKNGFWMTGLLNAKSPEFQSCVAMMFRGILKSHGIVHRLALSFPSIFFFGLRYRELLK